VSVEAQRLLVLSRRAKVVLLMRVNDPEVAMHDGEKLVVTQIAQEHALPDR
jgi:hypothetical protein